MPELKKKIKFIILEKKNKSLNPKKSKKEDDWDDEDDDLDDDK